MIPGQLTVAKGLPVSGFDPWLMRTNWGPLTLAEITHGSGHLASPNIYLLNFVASCKAPLPPFPTSIRSQTLQLRLTFNKHHFCAKEKKCERSYCLEAPGAGYLPGLVFS